MTTPDFALLDEAGLNLHAVLRLDGLSAALRAGIDPEQRYSQLILIGNGGRRLWDRIKAAGVASSDPIDDFSERKVTDWMTAQAPMSDFEIVYPGDRLVGLQSLGELAGWHFASPFMVGINTRWGPWFAYRAAVVANTDFKPSRREDWRSPCGTCAEVPCARSCPGGAITADGFVLENCVRYRSREDSACLLACRARLACPAGAEHRYSDEQMSHSYAVSLRFIKGALRLSTD